MISLLKMSIHESAMIFTTKNPSLPTSTKEFPFLASFSRRFQVFTVVMILSFYSQNPDFAKLKFGKGYYTRKYVQTGMCTELVTRAPN